MTEVEKAYLAGIIDGEGCIGIYERKNSHRPNGLIYTTQLSVCSTDKCLIDWIDSVCPEIGHIRSVQRTGNRKLQWVWAINDDNAARVLKEVIPYLVIKKFNAEILLVFRGTFIGRKHRVSENIKEIRKQLISEAKRLNQRGKVL